MNEGLLAQGRQALEGALAAADDVADAHDVDQGDAGAPEVSGNQLAAPIAKDVIEAVLRIVREKTSNGRGVTS